MNPSQSRILGKRSVSHLQAVMETDEALVQSAKHNPLAFAKLYRRYVKTVYTYHIARVGNIDDAQDLTTQTFLAAQEAISSFAGRSKFTTWLLAIANRKTADYFRRKRIILPLEYADCVPDNSSVPLDEIDRELWFKQVAQALNYLIPERAEAVTLRILGELSATEIAQIMGKSEAAVKMLVSRGLSDLRKYFKTDLQGE